MQLASEAEDRGDTTGFAPREFLEKLEKNTVRRSSNGHEPKSTDQEFEAPVTFKERHWAERTPK